MIFACSQTTVHRAGHEFGPCSHVPIKLSSPSHAETPARPSASQAHHHIFVAELR
ncbi:hypothetical protein BDN71DRAFT_1445573 [Pleurotus eryngii]|uniref:Uncharacterized protein n=1 Tax=Pleurotus eryngii TaxID=5323 RepID=A0A9P5ZZD4_PLEER|nr:hypothetical protein BDN71DRAFT_1445573 [Pleurotus eryngii]